MESVALVLEEAERVSLTAEPYLNVNLDFNYFNDNAKKHGDNTVS